jgi:hypothetical protein
MKRLLLISTILLTFLFSFGQNQTGKDLFHGWKQTTAYLNGNIGSKNYQSGLMGTVCKLPIPGC